MIGVTFPEERGAALLVVLVLLLILGWFTLSTFLVSGQHLQIVGNSQVRAQAAAAAQRAIEQTISSNLFTQDPAAIAAAPITTDVDGDGVPDFTATLTPQPGTRVVNLVDSGVRRFAFSFVSRTRVPVSSRSPVCGSTSGSGFSSSIAS